MNIAFDWNSIKGLEGDLPTKVDKQGGLEAASRDVTSCLMGINTITAPGTDFDNKLSRLFAKSFLSLF